MKLSFRRDTVLDQDGHIIFCGTTEETAAYLEKLTSVELKWVSVGETGDILGASQYLDLAT
jgi:hypothetical protein